MNRGVHRMRANLSNTRCAKAVITRPSSQKHALESKDLGLYFSRCYIATQGNLNPEPKTSEKTLYFCKRLKGTQGLELRKENSFVDRDAAKQSHSAEQNEINNVDSNLITELRKSLSAKEAEILKLRHEKVKMKMELEDCRKELKMQTRKLESLKSLFGESKASIPFLNEVLFAINFVEEYMLI
eukprot:TRINITY_DN4999_c0_g1_i2.p1 TRINITY_DN4999_c0_g1~~TRINITY_DN4999_c0_g1_i2.p1  ORF type:complete len:184 (+),score=46.10 TRINITY_DN4999_c0_g1_i2:159-710(+)